MDPKRALYQAWTTQYSQAYPIPAAAIRIIAPKISCWNPNNCTEFQLLQSAQMLPNTTTASCRFHAADVSLPNQQLPFYLLARGHNTQGTCGGDAQRMQSLRPQKLAYTRPQDGPTVTVSGKWGAACALCPVRKASRLVLLVLTRFWMRKHLGQADTRAKAEQTCKQNFFAPSVQPCSILHAHAFAESIFVNSMLRHLVLSKPHRDLHIGNLLRDMLMSSVISRTCLPLTAPHLQLYLLPPMRPIHFTQSYDATISQLSCPFTKLMATIRLGPRALTWQPCNTYVELSTYVL